MKKIIFASLILFVLILAYIYIGNRLKNIPKPITYEGSVITMTRSACFGTCPAYALSIKENGEVIYEGFRFVGVIGRDTSQISPEQVKELIDGFIKIDFFNLKDKYTAGITDLPTTIVTFSIDGKTKTVVDYYGAPEELHLLEEKIDKVTDSRQWVGECRKKGNCPKPKEIN